MPCYTEIADDLEKIAQNYPDYTTDTAESETVYEKGGLVLQCLPGRPAIREMAARMRGSRHFTLTHEQLGRL